MAKNEHKTNDRYIQNICNNNCRFNKKGESNWGRNNIQKDKGRKLSQMVKGINSHIIEGKISRSVQSN